MLYDVNHYVASTYEDKPTLIGVRIVGLSAEELDPQRIEEIVSAVIEDGEECTGFEHQVIFAWIYGDADKPEDYARLNVLLSEGTTSFWNKYPEYLAELESDNSFTANPLKKSDA